MSYREALASVQGLLMQYPGVHDFAIGAASVSGNGNLE
jgi:hypothetical protein